MTRDEHDEIVVQTELALHERGYRGLHAVAHLPNDRGLVGIWLFNGPSVENDDAIAAWDWSVHEKAPPIEIIVAGLIGEINNGGSFLTAANLYDPPKSEH